MKYKYDIMSITGRLRPGIRETHALCLLLLRLNVVKTQVRTDAIDEFHERMKLHGH